MSFLPGIMLDIGVMWMSKALFLPSSSSSWCRRGQGQSNTVGLCTYVLVFLSNSTCCFLQRMGTTLLCPNTQPHQNLTTVTCSKGNLLRAVRGSKSLRNARKYPPLPLPHRKLLLWEVLKEFQRGWRTVQGPPIYPTLDPIVNILLCLFVFWC